MCEIISLMVLAYVNVLVAFIFSELDLYLSEEEYPKQMEDLANAFKKPAQK